MYFMTWGINKPGIKEQRAAINETHWAFWDGYEGRLIARGPTLDPADEKSATGSIHIAKLESWQEAQVMAYQEPYAAAGLFKQLVLTRFDLELGRTQFDFEAQPGRIGFFIYCQSTPSVAEDRNGMREAHEAYCQAHDDIFVCRGSLLTDEGAWTGSAFFIEVADQTVAEAFLADEPYSRADLFSFTQLLRWRRGGRTNAPR